MGTLETIEKPYPEMSKSQKAIADYILESYDKAAYMTAAKLAEERRSIRVYSRKIYHRDRLLRVIPNSRRLSGRP